MPNFKELLISCENEYNTLQLRIKYLESELQKYKDKYDNIEKNVINVGNNIEKNVINVGNNIDNVINADSNDVSDDNNNNAESDTSNDDSNDVSNDSNDDSNDDRNDDSKDNDNNNIESIVMNNNSLNLQNSDCNDKSENDKIYYDNYKNIKEFIDLCLRRTEDSSIPIRKVKRVFITKSRNNYNYCLINTNINIDEFIEIVEDILETTITDDKLHNYSWCLVINENVHYKDEHHMKSYNNIKGLIQHYISFSESGELSIDKLKKIYIKNKKYKLSDINYKDFYNAFEELLSIRSYNGKFFNIIYKESKETKASKECKIRNELLISSILSSL